MLSINHVNHSIFSISGSTIVDCISVFNFGLEVQFTYLGYASQNREESIAFLRNYPEPKMRIHSLSQEQPQ